MKAFEGYHPIILFTFFLSLIFITMFTANPILLAISFSGAVCFTGMLMGLKKLCKSLLYSFPMLIIMALTNPLFVHRGETILFFMNDNPVTLEAILYGINISFMILSVFYWFKCYHYVMTSDKFIYIFGRVIPKLSLLLSMVINYVPKFKKRFREIDDAQKALGFYQSKSYIDRLRSKMRVLSILITWSLENSVEMADSMSARGYGLKGRTSFSLFKWTISDTIMMIVVILLTATICMLFGFGYGEFSFYPVISGFDFTAVGIILYVALILLAFSGVVTEIKENLLWRYLKSKI